MPGALGEVRFPLREGSRALPFSRPEVLSPQHPPSCSMQATITVAAPVDRSTRRLPSATTTPRGLAPVLREALSVERSNSRIKDPPTVDVVRGWGRVMGLTPTRLWLAAAIVARSLAVADAGRQLGGHHGPVGADARPPPDWPGRRPTRRRARSHVRGELLAQRVAPERRPPAPSHHARCSRRPTGACRTPLAEWLRPGT